MRKNLKRLIKSLKELRDVGNSIIVVEHDKEMILESDYIVDLGPEAGEHGGEVIFSGESKKFVQHTNITADYINGKRNIETPKIRRRGNSFNSFRQI